jgi:hypothetical protein
MELTWPVVGLVLGLVLLLMFKKQIGSFIERARKIGPGGVEAADERPGQPFAKPNVVEPLIKGLDSPLIEESEQLMRKDFEKRGISAQEDRERALFRISAAFVVAYGFEQLHNTIWASQWHALHFVNTRPDGVMLSELRGFYDRAAQQFPAWYQNYTFEQWLGFMESSMLLANMGGRKVISVRGREYLKFLITQGRASPLYG